MGSTITSYLQQGTLTQTSQGPLLQLLYQWRVQVIQKKYDCADW